MDIGFQMFSSEAQKSPNPKPTSKPSPSIEPTNTPLRQKSGNLKRVARAQGKKPQNLNMQAQDYCWAFGFIVEGGVVVYCFILPVVVLLSLLYLISR